MQCLSLTEQPQTDCNTLDVVSQVLNGGEEIMFLDQVAMLLLKPPKSLVAASVAMACYLGHGLLVHQDPQGLVCKAALWLTDVQYCCNCIIPSYMQDFPFDFSWGSCKLISQVCWESAHPNSSLTLQHVSCSPSLVSPANLLRLHSIPSSRTSVTMLLTLISVLENGCW